MGTVFRLVGCSGERNVDVFAGNPLVKVIFNLRPRKLDVNYYL